MTKQATAAPDPSTYTPDFCVNDLVMYRGNPENVWKIEAIHYPINAGPHAVPWVWAVQDARPGKPNSGTQQWFPFGVFTKIDEPKHKGRVHRVPAGTLVEVTQVAAAPVDKPKREKKAPDAIAELMDEGDCWVIAKAAGINVKEFKAKVGHLNPGLQRMNVGNRLRTMWKKGELDLEQVRKNFGVAK